MGCYDLIERRAIVADDTELRVRQHIHVARAVTEALNNRIKVSTELQIWEVIGALVLANGRLAVDDACHQTSWRASEIVNRESEEEAANLELSLEKADYGEFKLEAS
tara:strand:+ start:2328 stop:2648 length:321 start_codon:yes stop_codon:yes gene_type:complete